ncbi:unnamed protein product [Ranitomeya imitator]|uniref:Uncharacterized protein n=1 Tax=Ranitomeya imitator TaxID=111125 RepID=A0ABN9M8M2_9NEOB|nr:unnamed protein product [Ranitomeya imitator]
MVPDNKDSGILDHGVGNYLVRWTPLRRDGTKTTSTNLGNTHSPEDSLHSSEGVKLEERGREEKTLDSNKERDQENILRREVKNISKTIHSEEIGTKKQKSLENCMLANARSLTKPRCEELEAKIATGRRVSFTASHESMGSSSSNHNTSEDFSDASFGPNRHNETFNERSGGISKAKNAGGGRGGSTNELLDYSILRDLQSHSLEKDCNMNKDFGTPNALFYPVQSRPTVLDTFQELVERDLMKLDSNINFVHDNLTVLERQAISNLRHNEDLLIRQADKGGGVVILNAGLYYVENLRILSDCSTYTQIPYDPTKEFQIHLEKLLGAITQKIYDYLNIKHPVIPIYHAFPKIHKNVFPPPFRAIISGIGSLSENLGEWVDHFLQPLVINLPGYIKDTKAVIAALDGFLWSSHYTWVTCDVVGLYPSIPHNIILTSLSYFLNKYSTYKQEIQSFIIDSVSFLLTHNYFSFDRLFFIQKKGR